MPEKKISTYKVIANDFEFAINEEQVANTDMIEISQGVFNVIRDGRSINVEILSAEEQSKHITVQVEGQKFEVEIKDELDQLLQQMGFGTASKSHIKEIKAPMPGLVLDVLVAEGQELNTGDAVLILQAMKMENRIGLHAPGTIEKILVTKGQAVEKGQLLIVLA